ncbi:MAG: Hsp70 family protein [Pirellulales bacterium]|nr:Hsp70 family protein [Pirellulales bacterium]
MSSEQPPIGIDLGTTYSVVARLDSTGRPVTIPNDLGDLLTPSAIYVDEDEIIVGKEAVKAAVVKPEAYAECFKRDMGSVAFRRTVCGQKVPPEVLSAFVLQRLRRDAERRIGAFRKAVITVPAFFDESRRRTTQNAGWLAGLEVLDIINEPTAAAIACGCDRGFLDLTDPDPSKTAQRILVYDLGGGTFDVTILQIGGARFETLATDGDVRLGGKDFDQRLVDHLARQFQEAHGVDPRSDPQDAAQLWLDAQEAKHALSERTKTTALCFHAGIRMRIEVSRSEFEEMTADLLERTETTTSLVIRQAGLAWDQIDRVLLVGGSSRMPMVRAMLRKLAGREPDCSQSPDEAVAHGAALYAGVLLAKEAGLHESACEVVNVNSHSLGVVGVHRTTGRKTNVVLIPKNTRLPASASRVFHTAQADGRSIRVPVVEGESERPEDCIALGECVVRDLPPGLPAGATVEVEYRYAANGRISVVARVPAVRYSARVEIERAQAPDLDDLDTWRARLLGKPHWDRRRADEAIGKATVDLGSRESILERLDALYAKVGVAAVHLSLPAALSSCQQAAIAAVKELSRAKGALARSEEAAQATLHDAAALHQGASVSQARTKCEEAQVRADFASLVLGRECVDRGFTPPGVEKECQEIGQLRRCLQSADSKQVGLSS